MSHTLTGHPKVDAIALVNFEGDITPRSWYKHIVYQTKNGEKKVDRLAIDVLSDIVYWYRPFQKRHELTGEVISWQKKFAESVLRRSPDAFAESLNASVRCVRESIRLLEGMGLVTVILQPVRTAYGVIPNVMHIDINPDAIADITYRPTPSESAETIEKSLLTKWVTSNDEMSNNHLRNRQQPLTKPSEEVNETVESSIYRDFSEITQEITLKRQEKKQFGFEINPEETKPTSLVTTEPNLDCWQGTQLNGKGHFSAAAVVTEIFGQTNRRVNTLKGTLASAASDPWMVSASNPNPVFAQWLFNRHKSQPKGGEWASLSNAKSEIRNDHARASDLWEEFLAETQNRFETLQTVLTSGGTLRQGELEEIQAIAPYAPAALTSRVFQLATSTPKEKLAPAVAPGRAIAENTQPTTLPTSATTYQIPPELQKLTPEEMAANAKRIREMMSKAFDRRSLPAAKPSTLSTLTIEEIQELLKDKSLSKDSSFQRDLKSWVKGRNDVVFETNDQGLIYAIERF